MRYRAVRIAGWMLVAVVLVAGCSEPSGEAGWSLDGGVSNDSSVSKDVDGEQQGWESVQVGGDEGESSAKVDLLWVIDNSGTMCERQATLREDFARFVEDEVDGSVDLHTAVTTTHFNEQFPLEKVARPGYLQSTPHPPVGAGQTCRARPDGQGPSEDVKYPGEFAPTKRQIEQAVKCTKDYSEDPDEFPDELRELYDPEDDRVAWSDEAIECALRRTESACDAAGKNQGRFRAIHLFPCAHLAGDYCDRSDFREVYRNIPKVLRTSDYRNGDGSLDRDAMVRDFQCMSFVGTRGDGQEEGLHAASRALSPRMTGGPVGDPIEDSSTVQSDGEDWSYPDGDPTQAPNHGFLREDARTMVVFMSDENDCSRPEDADIISRYQCAEMNCYFAAKETRQGDGPLFETGELAERFRQNLAASKRVEQVDGDEVTVATIDGGYEPYDGEIRNNCDDPSSLFEQLKTCLTDRGAARSGDRYQDFAKKFEDTIPSDAGSSSLGARMCHRESGIYATLLEIGNLFEPSSSAPACYDIEPSSCRGPSDCSQPEYGVTETPEAELCQSVVGRRFCLSSAQVRLRYADEEADDSEARSALVDSGLCYEASIGQVGDGRGCVVQRSVYEWRSCELGDGRGLRFDWDSSAVGNPDRQLADFSVQIAHR